MNPSLLQPVSTVTLSELQRDVFGKAANGTKLILAAFSRLLQGQRDHRLTGRLNAVLTKVIKSDTQHPAIDRSVQHGDLSYLRGFDLFHKKPLGNHLFIQPSVHVDRATGSCSIQGGMVDPLHDIKEPWGSHYSFAAALTAIDFDQRRHVTDIQESALLPMKQSTLLELRLRIPGHQPGPLLVALCFRQYEVVNGQSYLMASHGSGACALIEVVPGMT